jgi:hypothetical protein
MLGKTSARFGEAGRLLVFGRLMAPHWHITTQFDAHQFDTRQFANLKYPEDTV